MPEDIDKHPDVHDAIFILSTIQKHLKQSPRY